MEKGRIGEILQRHTSLTEDQLKEALEFQESEGGRLGEILVRKNYIKPGEILRALGLQLGIPTTDDLRAGDIDPRLVEALPINYCKSNRILPIHKIGGVVTVAIADPTNLAPLEDLRMVYRCSIRTVLSLPEAIEEAINKVYERSNGSLIADIDQEFDEDLNLDGPIDILDATENDAPIIKFVNSILFRAVKERSSDIHVEPYEKDVVIRFRIDGVLYDVIRQPKKAHASIISRIKVMGQLDIAEKRKPQDGRITIKLAGKDIDLRLNTVPTVFGERAVMRLLEKSNTVSGLPALGFDDEYLKKIYHLIRQHHGIFLVTGPTGAGKSTTLSACIATINDGGRITDKNIITVEDPVEYQLKGVSQIQVNPKIDFTFAQGLRAILRQDPDVVMIGEIRDRETAEIAINASLTGHMVLSTLHTNDAPGATTRLLDMGVEPFLVSSSLLGVINQRLIRKVCMKCREAYAPTIDELAELGIPAGANVPVLYRAKGCPACNNKGYSGRTGIYELMIIDDDIRNLILKRADANSIKVLAIERGMRTLRHDGISKVLAGLTTLQELITAIQAE